MTIFFTCSTKEILKYQDFYKEIRTAILKLDHKINRDWLLDSITSYVKTGKDVPPASVYEQVLEAILSSDMVIVDATVRSMSIGHQISFALSKNKPVLILRYVGSNGDLNDLFINNEKSPLLCIQEYTSKEDIYVLIKNDLTQETKLKTRFNLVLTKEQNSYIEWASFKYQKSKTEIIHEALDNKLKKDKLYNK